MGLYVKQLKSMADVRAAEVEEIVECAVECGSTGKVRELIYRAAEGRAALSSTAAAAWIKAWRSCGRLLSKTVRLVHLHHNVFFAFLQ